MPRAAHAIMGQQDLNLRNLTTCYKMNKHFFRECPGSSTLL